MDELQTLKAKVAELSAQLAQTEAELTEVKLSARNAAIDALNIEFSAEEKADLHEMSIKAFALFSAKAIAKPQLPAHLFSEQATKGKEEGGQATSVIDLAAIYANRAKRG